jgi:hypothetical protein
MSEVDTAAKPASSACVMSISAKRGAALGGCHAVPGTGSGSRPRSVGNCRGVREDIGVIAQSPAGTARTTGGALAAVKLGGRLERPRRGYHDSITWRDERCIVAHSAPPRRGFLCRVDRSRRPNEGYTGDGESGMLR